MMGWERQDRGPLFYEFSIEEMILIDHLLRRISVSAMAVLAD